MAARNPVDTTPFNTMLRDMSRSLNGVKCKPIVLAEFGKAMEVAVVATRKAAAAKIKAHRAASQFTAQHASLYQPRSKAGQKYRDTKTKLTKNGYILYALKGARRYPNQLWAAIKARRAVHTQRILAARGLAAKSWYRLMANLGVEIKTPNFVKSAVPSRGGTFSDYSDVTSSITATDDKVRIDFSNAQPTAVKFAQGHDALRRGLAGRVKFFNENLKRFVFNDLGKTAAKYPKLGIKVTPEAARAFAFNR